MAYNRRRAEGEVTFSWVAVRLFLFAILVGSLLGILCLKRHHLKLGDELRLLDHDLEAGRQRILDLEVQLARLKTPAALENKAALLQLGMIRPNENQIRRVREGVIYSEKLARPRILAQTDSLRKPPQAPQ